MNLPSLSDLISAYTNNGAGQAVQSLQQGVQGGMALAAQKAKVAQDQQNKLQELATQKQIADAQTSDAAAKYIDPDTFNAGMAGQPLASGKPVPASFADVLQRSATQKDLSKQHTDEIHFQGEQNRLQREATAQEAAAARQAASAATLQGKREGDIGLATANAVKAHSWLPWTTAAEKMANQSLDQARQAAFGTAPQSFNSPEEAAAAKPAVGSTVIINGVPHVVGAK